MKLMGKLIPLFALVFLVNSCGFYSFTGYEISAENVSVSYFENQAPIQSADLSQIFTNKLEQKLIQETPLKLVRTDGELQFSGAITGYSQRAASVTGESVTDQTELSVTVYVEYVNSKDDAKSFSQSFTASQTFDANSDLSSVETGLLEDITDQLVQNIFNKAFIDW